MKKIKKIHVYLDYNIYTSIAKGIIEDNIFKDNNIEVHLSVGHAEEYYKAMKNDINNEYGTILDKVLNEMIKLSPRGVLNPSKTKIKNTNECIKECIRRVKKYDTTDIVVAHGKSMKKSQKEAVELHMKKNTQIRNYSNLSSEEIWKQKEVLEELNKVPECFEEYKKITFNQIQKYYGINQAYKICDIDDSGFEIREGCYSDLKEKYKLLEFTIEHLHDLLSRCGYNRDKEEKKLISGIHDVQHSIYATYCDYFVSEDRAFSKRANAIYNFLGIKTKVVDFIEFKSFINEKIS